MSLENVYVTPDVMASCYLHAMSTEKEEIIGLLLGEIVPMDDSFFEELSALEGGGEDGPVPVSTDGVRMVPVAKGSHRFFGNATLGEGYGGGVANASSGGGGQRVKYSGPTIARVWGMRAIPRIGDRRKDRVEVSDEIYRATVEAERCSVTFGRHTRVVGWYHSHPHITPYPSHVDLATQASYQAMENGWVGLIFSVFPNSNTSSTTPRVPIGLERQLSSATPIATSQPMTPTLHHDDRAASPPRHSGVPPSDLTLHASTQHKGLHLDPSQDMAVDDALAATTARDTATDVPAAATTHEDPPSCGSFVMAEHPNEDAMIPIGQQGSCDISSQSQDAPTPPATKTSPSQYFGDCHGDVDEVYETETIDEYLMPAASRHMCLASSHQGNPPVGIKRLGTGGSSQFGAPTISAHCFQSSPPVGGVGPHGHRKVPLITTPLMCMPLCPTYTDNTIHGDDCSLAASAPLSPQFSSEVLRVLSTLCEETDAARVASASMDGNVMVKELVSAAIEMQILERDAIITKCTVASMTNTDIPQLERALEELKALSLEVDQQVATH